MCISACQPVESSYLFVDRMINQEREKLVRNFQSYVGTPETCLAALHAVCVYQALGLFGDNFAPATIIPTHSSKENNNRRREESERTAELHSSFLLKLRGAPSITHLQFFMHRIPFLSANAIRWHVRYTKFIARPCIFTTKMKPIGIGENPPSHCVEIYSWLTSLIPSEKRCAVSAKFILSRLMIT